MTAPAPAAAPIREAPRLPLRTKLGWVAVLYFAEGFPFGIVVDNLPVYFRVHGVSLVDLGLMSLVGLPWTLKVLWAPLVDRFGERRHWIVGALLAMAALLAALPGVDPRSLALVWVLLFALAAASATQDVAIDAYTIGFLERGEEGVANGVRVSAYRAALIVGGGGLLALADLASWTAVFLASSAVMLVLAAVAWRTPPIPVDPAARTRLLEGLRGWLSRPGAPFVFLFVLTYKLGDAAMGPMVKPFWVDRGMTPSEIGLVSTTVGVGLSIAGALLGGAFTSRFGIYRSLWVLGLAQAGSNLGYAATAWLDGGRAALYASSMLESFTGGLGTAAFLAFLMRACDREHAATEYAALSAVFGFTRTVAGAASGWATASLGYGPYFAFTFLLAFPAYALLPWVRGWTAERPA